MPAGNHELVLQRDPLQSLASPLRPDDGAAQQSGPFHFLAGVAMTPQAFMVSRDSTDQFTRFCSGDKIQDGTITRIESDSVIIQADDGKRQVVEIDAGTLGR